MFTKLFTDLREAATCPRRGPMPVARVLPGAGVSVSAPPLPCDLPRPPQAAGFFCARTGRSGPYSGPQKLDHQLSYTGGPGKG